MCEISFILNVCFLIALVSTSPIPQKVDVQIYPGTYCDQSVFTNSLIGLFNGQRTSDKTTNRIASDCANQANEIFLKILYDRIINNPKLVEIMNDIQRSSDVDISHHIPSPGSAPNIVNNYIIIPPDLNKAQSPNIKEDVYTECLLNTPDICTRVKKNADSQPEDLVEIVKNKQTDIEVTKVAENPHFIVNNQNNRTIYNRKEKIRKVSKRPSSKSEPTQTKKENQKDSSDVLVIENQYQSVNKTKKNLANERTSSSNKTKTNTGDSYISEKDGTKTVRNQQNKKSNKSSTSRKKINGIKLKQGDLVNGKAKTLIGDGQKKKSKGQPHKDDTKNKQKIYNPNRSRNTFNSINQDYQFPNMPYDSNSMYEYINAIMSNYQLGNNDYKQEFPFNFNNFYQLPQLSNPRSSKKQSRYKSYKRRKHPRLYRRRNNRKRVYSRRKPVDKKVDEIKTGPNKLITSIPFPSLDIEEKPYIAVTKSDNETVIITENGLEQKNNISHEENEKGNIVSSIFDDLSFVNNSLPAETYNSHPSFIVGIDDNVPIISENSLMDDYYPDFTADEVLQLTTEETNPVKYHGDKYHYVSNKKFDFGDLIRKRKRIAMKNMSKNSNLFFSDTEGTKNVTSSQEDGGVKEKMNSVHFKSPHFLDNPDFRTRKIDSNEIYEPYHYHNIYQDPEEGYNKYDIDDTTVVYSTPLSDNNNVKTKSCNDIEDGLAKWRKNKDSNVETVYARAKLAKYGLAL